MNPPLDLTSYRVRKESFECSITTDIVVFGYVNDGFKILLTKRNLDNQRYNWMLPGGVMESHETLKDAAAKVLQTLTGFKESYCEQVQAYSDLQRHPLKRVITVSFYALVKPENQPLLQKGKNAEMAWFPVETLPQNLGFDHRTIIKDAHHFLKVNLNDQLIVAQLLPQKFTLPELQNLYEKIMGTPLDKRNFRKRIFQKDILDSTGEKKRGVKGGPMLYTCKAVTSCYGASV